MFRRLLESVTAAPLLVLLVLPSVCFAGIVAGGSAEMIKPYEQDLIQLGYRLVGEKSADKFHQLPSTETTIRIFRRKNPMTRQTEIAGLYFLPNLEIYAFARKVGDQPMIIYLDEDNDGYCERIVEPEEDFTINFRAYHYDVR